jgi:ribosome assembly protein YihI (activator of Der GTPase)
MSSNEEKLDQIIALLKEQNEELKKISENNQSIVDDGLNAAKDYLMKHYNITWLNDKIEEDIYEAIILVIKKFVKF